MLFLPILIILASFISYMYIILIIHTLQSFTIIGLSVTDLQP